LPELPEVETTLRGVEPYVKHEHIQSIIVRNPNLRWPVSEQVETLSNALVVDIIRRGKYIILEFDSGAILIHLGMSGNLRVVSANRPVEKHDHVDFVMASGKVIRFNDPRRFGCILWAKEWREHALISHLGLEPLTDEFTADYLYRRSKGKKTSIKQFIMNGKLVVGVGNIYANEALFLSGISPKRAAGRVSLARMKALVRNIKAVLTAAIAQGGTTLKDFVNSDGSPGYFKQQLFVYGRAGKACKHCGAVLEEIRQNNRSSVYCSTCQT